MKKIISLFLLLSLSLSYLTLLQAQVPSTKEVELLASWSGQAQSVQVQGQYAYVGLNNELLILDLSNPKSPQKASQTIIPANPFIEDIQVVGNIGYIAAGWRGLRLIDLSQPSNPSELSAVDTNDHAYRVVISGTRAYLAYGDKGLRIFDVSNSQSPQLLAEADAVGVATDLVLVGHQLYLADDRGLQLIDVSNPTLPVVKQKYVTLKMEHIVVSGSTVYMADALQNGLYLAPLSNITQTTFYPLPGQVQAMRLVNNLQAKFRLCAWSIICSMWRRIVAVCECLM